LEAETKQWERDKKAGDLIEGTRDSYDSVLNRCQDIKNGLYELHTEWKEAKSRGGWILKVKSRAAYMYWTKKSPIDELRQKLHLAKMDIVLLQLQWLRMSDRNERILEKLEVLEGTLKSTLKSLDNSTDSEKNNANTQADSNRHEDAKSSTHRTVSKPAGLRSGRRSRLRQFIAQRTSRAESSQPHKRSLPLRRSIGSLDSCDTTAASVSVAGSGVSTSGEELLQMLQDATQNRPGSQSDLISWVKKAFTERGAKTKSLSSQKSAETRKAEPTVSSATRTSTVGSHEGQRDMDRNAGDTGSREHSQQPNKSSSKSIQENGDFETGSIEQHGRGAETLPSTGTFADLTTEQCVSSADAESVDIRSGIHPYPTYADKYIRPDTAMVALGFGPRWDLLLFQEPRNCIQCALVPRTLVMPAKSATECPHGKVALKPRTVIFSSSLEAAPGSCLRAVVFQSRVHVVFIKEKEEGKFILADAYLRFEPESWHSESAEPETLADSWNSGSGEPEILAGCWKNGDLEAQDVELSSSAEITILQGPDGFPEVCIQLESGQTEHLEWKLDLGKVRSHKPPRYSEKPSVSQGGTPNHWQPGIFQTVYDRCWGNGWPWSTDNRSNSFLVIKRNEEKSCLESKLINWESLATEFSELFGLPVPFRQVSWESVVLERETFAGHTLGDNILIFFSACSGELFCARLRLAYYNDFRPNISGFQHLASLGSTKAGTKMAYTKGRLFFISEEGLLMVLALKLKPNLGEEIYDVGECQPVLANGCYMTDLGSMSRFDLGRVYSLCEAGPLEGFSLV